MKNRDDNYLVLLRSGDIILKVIGQFSTMYKAKLFIKEKYPHFYYVGDYQWNKFQSDQFITIES